LKLRVMRGIIIVFGNASIMHMAGSQHMR